MRTAAAVVLASALLIPSVLTAGVVIKRPHIVYRASEGVSAACNGPKAACTHIDMEFYCGCDVARNGSWTLVPTIIATPTIYSTSDSMLRHELSHISDVHKALNEYAASLLLRTFENEGACRQFVATEAKSFSTTAKSVQRSTTIRRDGIQYAGAPPQE